MSESEKPDKPYKKNWGRTSYHAGFGGIYAFGIIGSAIYFIQHASSFGDGILGIIKAIFWPAFLVYKVFELLKI